MVRSLLLFVIVANKTVPSFRKISSPSASRVMSVAASRIMSPLEAIVEPSIVRVSTTIPSLAVMVPAVATVPLAATVNLLVSTAIPPFKLAVPLEVMPVKPDAAVAAKTVFRLAMVVSTEVLPTLTRSLSFTSFASR